MSALGLALLGAAAAVGLVALDRVAGSVVRPVPTRPERSVADSGLRHEPLRVRSGGHDLAAWLLSPPQAAGAGPLLLLVHGWGASSATVLRLAEPLVRSGCEVLLFDLRGHGGNEAVPFVTVRHLRDDVLAVARHAAERFPGRSIVLVGHSFGGAAGVLAAAEGAPLAGLVLIAAPADVLRITAEYLTDKGLPGRLLVGVLRPFWWWRIGGSFRPHTPVRRIRELDVPLLLVQPELDRRVAREHAERLAAAAGVPYRLVPGREHTDVLEAPETVRMVIEFVAAVAGRDVRSARAG